MSNKEFDPDKMKQGKIKQGKNKQDKEFEQDKEFLTLHEEYQAVSTEMPAESTDLNILNAAHSAINSQQEADHVIPPVQIEKVKKHAWYVPVSYVAIVVLSLSVFLNLAFEPEFIDAELNDADFAEEALLSEINRQFTDKQDKTLNEQKIISENDQQQIADLQKERMQESARLKSKQKTAPKKRLLLKQQAASPSMSGLPQLKREAVNENAGVAAGAGAEAVPAMSQMSLPEPVQNQQTMPDTVSATDIVSDNEQQIKQVNELIKLFETKQLEELKKALAVYRKSYPYNKETDLLPRRIQEQEKRWQLEKEVKSLRN